MAQRNPVQAVERDTASEAAAVAAIHETKKAMVQLCAIVEEETALVRAGRLSAAAAVAERKGDLARTFMTHAMRVRGSAHYLARTRPKLLEDLREQHEQFRAKLQINLTVLATARAVTENIVRGVASQLARRSAPHTYGASGRHIGGRRAGAPIAVSRSL